MKDYRPIIAITGNYAEGKCTMLEGYFASVITAGAVPVIVPPFADERLMEGLLDHVDGIIFSGGGDIDPHLLGEEPIPEVGDPNAPRDAQELPLMRMAVRRQMPILGICRGMQVMTAALGGKLWQDIYVQASATTLHDQGSTPRHMATHGVSVLPDTLLARIYGLKNDTDAFAVNSFHHQAVREAAPGFRVSAAAPDGIIEAVESTEGKPIIGVQWHPECMILGEDRSMLPIFHWLVGEAIMYARTCRFHDKHITLDTHCDTPMFFEQKVDFGTRDPRILVNLPHMTDGRLDATIMVAYLRQDMPGEYDYAATTQKTESLLDGIVDIAARYPDKIAIAHTPQELREHKDKGLKSIMLGIENGYAIGEDLRLVEHFRQRGVVYMTLCHNGNNAICGSARPRDHETLFVDKGLTAFGHEVVREMNRVGMMVDLSHASEESFYDAVDTSLTPIVCSHSSCRALCNHPRNITDEQLLALRDCDGVAQICLYDGFLRKGGGATVDDAVAHILHAISVAGIDHVGIGTDFDGDGGITGCANAAEVMNITRRLLAEGLSKNELEKIWGGNFLRVMSQCQASV